MTAHTSIVWVRMTCPSCPTPVSACTFAALFAALFEHAHASPPCADAVRARIDAIAAGHVHFEYQILPDVGGPRSAGADRSGE